MELDELAAALPGRAVRAYPALLSTEAEALAWARADAPAGAVVLAGYQVSPRGRSGLPWEIGPADLAFSLVLRPRLPAEREGWLYTIAASGVADAVGTDASIEWPDEVRRAHRSAGAVGVQAGLGPGGVEWAVVNVVIREAGDRAALLGRALEAIEARSASPSAAVLADYLRRCGTVGRDVRARMVPLGPAGPVVEGRAVTSLTDGALVIETAEERRMAVRPQSLGLLEDA